MIYSKVFAATALTMLLLKYGRLVYRHFDVDVVDKSLTVGIAAVGSATFILEAVNI